jgi:V/A-type H+/Na+-transporting ATPase subunit I
MSLHPLPPNWFELVVPESDVDDALEALARRGGVQFEWTGESDAADRLAPLREISRRWRRLAADYARFWPAPVFERRCCTLPLKPSARAALHQLELWRAEGATRLAEIAHIEDDLDALRVWQHALPVLGASKLELELLANAGPTLVACCLLWPDTSGPPLPASILSRPLPARDGRSSALVLALQDQIEALRHQAIAAGGRCLRLPDWLASARSPTLGAELSTRIEQAEKQLASLEAALRELAVRHRVGPALGVLERIAWFLETAAQIRCDGQYCWITGWTAEPDPGPMNRTLRDIGIAPKLKFVPPPQHSPSPSVTGHPRWLQPFEIFADAIGVPGLREADPTTWVALLVPLLFGYMCGDLGHGALILLAGVLLRRRTRLWPLLAFCGLASMGFGFIYGDLFGFHDLIPSLWLHPMDDPLQVLAVPVAAGALVLTLGVLLHSLQTCWRGEGSSAGVADAAQLLTYWGLLLAVADLRFGWVAVAGVALCAVNRLWHEPTPLALLASLGHLLESTLQLLLNTISFARVGAFALAHAALESAVVGVAVGLDSLAVAAIVVILGNLVIVVLEGVVVGVQTTRLVLFEFFMRFFQGEGRPFLPVMHPPARHTSARHPQA